jgi:nucleotide-binding universal stress UspA family protein
MDYGKSIVTRPTFSARSMPQITMESMTFGRPTMRHFLLATDDSSGAGRACDVAAEFAKVTGGKLSILTVGGNLSKHQMQELRRAPCNIGDALSVVSDQILAHAEQRVRRAGVSDVQRHAGWGDPAEVIIKTAQRLHADTIVMGRRGRGRLAGLLLGSVSQKVATHAPCIVILVP